MILSQVARMDLLIDKIFTLNLSNYSDLCQQPHSAISIVPRLWTGKLIIVRRFPAETEIFMFIITSRATIRPHSQSPK
jgi:hypothetical protein